MISRYLFFFWLVDQFVNCFNYKLNGIIFDVIGIVITQGTTASARNTKNRARNKAAPPIHRLFLAFISSGDLTTLLFFFPRTVTRSSFGEIQSNIRVCKRSIQGIQQMGNNANKITWHVTKSVEK